MTSNTIKRDQINNNTSNKTFHRFFNSLSNIPMLDTSHLVDDSFYKTTYREDFVKKNRLYERKIDRPADFSVYSKPYDYKELSAKLCEKGKQTGENMNMNMNNLNEFSSDSFNSKLSKSAYWNDTRDPEAIGLYDSNSETRSSFNGHFHVYQRPVIPSYIKRDQFYQTNAEKSIGFLRTDQGILIPNVPDTARKGKFKFSYKIY